MEDWADGKAGRWPGSSAEMASTGGAMTRRDHEVIHVTQSHVKNNTELTNFEKLTRIEWHNGK